MEDAWWNELGTRNQEQLQGIYDLLRTPPVELQQGGSFSLAQSFSDAATTLDAAAFGISLLEAAVADVLYAALIGAGAQLGGPAGATAGLKLGFSFDVVIAGTNPLARAEDILGFLSFGATAAADVASGNFDLDPRDRSISLGKNTAVTAVHAVLGLIPEANFDLAVSASQLAYDLDRHPFLDPGGSVTFTWGWQYANGQR